MRVRHGFTLVEVLIALTITALIGAALTSVLVTQSRFFDQQEKLSSARQVSRSALNMLMAELRMVETSGGVTAASPTAVTVNVPYAMGIACGTVLGVGVRATLLPVDTTIWNRVTPSGWAIRSAVTGPGSYDYNAMGTLGQVLDASSTTTCSNAGIAIPDGKLVTITPAPSFTIEAGSALILYHQVSYSFAASASVPGRLALWRQAAGGSNEEIVAPFDDVARFRFLVVGSQAAQDAAPSDLTTLRGLEVVLDGVSERPSAAGADRAVLTTAVFFRNTP
jgi:prepilin-type N-terminal cleavage/methylation domain-containing protein